MSMLVLPLRFTSLFRSVLFLAALAICIPFAQGQAKEPDSTTASDEGFIDLFASGDFSLWKIDGANDNDRARQTELWSISDQVIAAAGKKYGFIRYDKKLCDFVCRLEYKLPRGGNSGIGIRGAVYQGGGSRPSRSGYGRKMCPR